MMKSYKSVGNVIAILRDTKKITQGELASLINVSRTVIAKIENSERQPTQEQLIALSQILSFDLLTFEQRIQYYQSLKHYLLANKLIHFIHIGSIDKIAEIIHTNPIFKELTYGHAYTLKMYCETIVHLHIDKNIDIAFENCMNFFHLSNIDFTNFIPLVNQPDYYYSMILNLSYCTSKKGFLHETLILDQQTVSFFEKMYFNEDLPFLNVDSFYKKFYVVCLNNLADGLCQTKDYQIALDICNKGIQQSNILNILSVLPSLLKLKLEILCTLNQISELQEVNSDFKSICRLTNQQNYFEVSMESLKKAHTNLSQILE